MAKRILLADDSITIQKVVELTFSDGDYEVTAVNNGTKAIQALSQMRPDIILSDIIMPEKNGYEVCEFVKSHPEYRNIPVVLLTGTFEPFDPDRADKAGCDAVVTKPFESQNLIHKVEELIEAARSKGPAAPSAPAPAAESPFSTTAVPAQSGEIFGGSASAPPPAPSGDTPFEAPAPVGETKAFPKLSFEELQQIAKEAAVQASPASSASRPTPAPEASPWEEQAPSGGETRAFPKMNFEEMPAPSAAPPPPPPPPPSAPAVEMSPWDEAPAPPAAETRAFPKMNFEDMPPMASAPAAKPEAPPQPQASSPWDEKPAQTGSETRAVPPIKMEEARQEPAAEEAPLRSPSPMASSSSMSGAAGDLSEDQLNRIARRVVELMSEQVVRNIAWEVVPDVAEMIVKERIRQLESEA